MELKVENLCTLDVEELELLIIMVNIVLVYKKEEQVRLNLKRKTTVNNRRTGKEPRREIVVNEDDLND